MSENRALQKYTDEQLEGAAGGASTAAIFFSSLSICACILGVPVIGMILLVPAVLVLLARVGYRRELARRKG